MKLKLCPIKIENTSLKIFWSLVTGRNIAIMPGLFIVTKVKVRFEDKSVN